MLLKDTPAGTVYVVHAEGGLDRGTMVVQGHAWAAAHSEREAEDLARERYVQRYGVQPSSLRTLSGPGTVRP